MRAVTTSAFGVRAPIIRPGDNLVKITADCVLEAANKMGLNKG